MTASTLNRFPPEIRLQIFRYALCEQCATALVGTASRKPTGLLAALRSSSRDKVLYHEALGIFHRENGFRICPDNEAAVQKLSDNVKASVYHLYLYFDSTARMSKKRRYVEFHQDSKGRITKTNFGAKCTVSYTILPQIHFDTLLHSFTGLRSLFIDCVNVFEDRFFSVHEFVVDALHKLKTLEEFTLLVYPYIAVRAQDSYNRKLFLKLHETISRGLGVVGKGEFRYDEKLPMDRITSSTPLILWSWKISDKGQFLSWKV